MGLSLGFGLGITHGSKIGGATGALNSTSTAAWGGATREALAHDATYKHYPPVTGQTYTVGTIYYVSATGSDAADGLTTGTPWQTLTKVNAAALSPGDKVLFNGGDTFSGQLVVGYSGELFSPIVYGSYGTGKATISSVAASAVVATNKSYFVIADLICTGNGLTTNTISGVDITGTSARMNNVYIIGLDVSQYGKHGINVSAATAAYGATNLLIDGCDVADCCGSTAAQTACGINVKGQYGVALRGYTNSNVIIQWSTATGCTGRTGLSNWSGTGIGVFQTNRGVIQYCETSYNGENCDTSGGASGVLVADASSVVTRYCESHHNARYDAPWIYDGNGFSIDGGSQYCGIEYCYSHDNWGVGFQLFDYVDPPYMQQNIGNFIRFSITVNDGTHYSDDAGVSINVDGGFSPAAIGNYVYGNVIYQGNTGAGMLGFGAGGQTGIIANNIFYATALAGNMMGNYLGTAWGDTEINGNLYYRVGGGSLLIKNGSTAYATLDLWKAASGLESGTGVEGNPSFVDPTPVGTVGGYVPASLVGYKLATGSPALEAGVNISTLFGLNAGTIDFFGNTLSAPLNIGAYDGGGI